MNVNKVILVGRITRSGELKATKTGVQVLNFSIATTKKIKDKEDRTEFHNIVTFGKRAEVIAKYFIKGQEIFIEGWLQTRSWDDKDNGAKRYATEIILEGFDFGAKPKGAENVSPEDQNTPTEEKTIEYPEESIEPSYIPF